MKTIILFIWILSSTSVWAVMDNEKGNGGDSCENRIKIIRDDIESWIFKGGSKGLRIPENISSDQYNLKMLNAFKSSITCNDEKIYIGASEKTCKNFKDNNGIKWIQCNFNRFNNTKDADQYRLIHHEYAGISGFEVNTDEESDYTISNQITDYLKPETILRLAVIPNKKRIDANQPCTITAALEYGEFVGYTWNEDLQQEQIVFQNLTTNPTSTPVLFGIYVDGKRINFKSNEKIRVEKCLDTEIYWRVRQLYAQGSSVYRIKIYANNQEVLRTSFKKVTSHSDFTVLSENNFEEINY